MSNSIANDIANDTVDQETLTPESAMNYLRAVIDPEIYQNIVDLGLVYGVEIQPDQSADVTMTLTTPHCPMGPQIIENVEQVLAAKGASATRVHIVWEPMWTPDAMTDELKRELGIIEDEEEEEEEPLYIPPPPPAPKKKGFLGAPLWALARAMCSVMTQRVSYRSYQFRPPIWRPTKQLNLQTVVLVVALLGWLALYGALGWRLWSTGLAYAGRLEIGLGIACIVVGIPVALGWWSALRRWRARLQVSQWPALSLEKIGELTPAQFEEYVAQRLFARQGYQVENTRDSKDGGVDIIVTDPVGRRAIVQVKLYRNAVGEPFVRDLYGALIHAEAHMAFLVTNSTISSAARRWAAGKPIALIDGAQLVELSRAEPTLTP